MANFNRRTGSFSFFYLLVNFIATISMSHLFITAATTSLSEAMTPVSVLFWICLFLPVLLSQLQICTAGVVGSTILIQLAMLLKVYLLMSFHGRSFECSQFIPSGPGHPTSGKNVICSPVSSVPSRSYVLGDDYIYVSYKYKWAHAWRNQGTTLAYAVFLFIVYIILCELNKNAMQKCEILLFHKKRLKSFEHK